MSAFTDLFISKKELAQRALQEKLVSARTLTGGYDVDTIMGVYHDAYDQEALDAILAQKPKSEKNYKNRAGNEKLAKAQGSAQYLKDLKEAEIALQKGDIAPAVSLASKGRYHAFKEVTKDTGNVHALTAKASLWAKKEFHNPPGDHGDPSFNNTKAFAASQARQAVEGYNALGMEKECEQAMRGYIENAHFEEDEYFSTWQKEFHDGKPDNEAKNKAVYNIVKFGQRNGASFEDHLAAAQFLTDDAVRERAINAMSDMMNVRQPDESRSRNYLQPEQEEQLFKFLTDYIKTKDGKPQPSQFTAMNVLMQDHKDKFTSNGFDQISKEGQAVLDVVHDEMLLGSQHVVQEAFVKGDMLQVLQMNERVKYKDDKRTVTMRDVIPSDLGGEQINQARNDCAGKFLRDVKDNVLKGCNVNENARNVALLSHDVLNNGDEPSSDRHKEVATAVENLAQLISMEAAAQKLNYYHEQNKLAEVENSGASEMSKDFAREHIQRESRKNTVYGYGRMVLEDLNKNPMMQDVVADIQKNITQTFEPENALSLTKNELCQAVAVNTVVPTTGVKNKIVVV